MFSHNEHYRFGSASWETEAGLRRAGLLGATSPLALQFGYRGELPLCFASDAPAITVAGAGAGKMRDLLALAVALNAGERMFVLDPRGEIAAVTMPSFAMARAKLWCWNPYGIASLPQHRANPLDLLSPDSQRLHADCRFFAEAMIPLTGSANGKYFELLARDLVENLLKSHVESAGQVGFADLARAINAIESDNALWASILERMLNSSHDSVRRCAGSTLSKQQDSPREFGGIVGELYAHLGCLNNPALLASLSDPDFAMRDLFDPRQPATMMVNHPIEYIGVDAPVIRAAFTAIMLLKSRMPEAPRITMIIDEAGQLGPFPELQRAYSFARGAGVRTWALFQDTGQIVRNFGMPGLQGFLGSAALRQFFGVRDFETAAMISSMLGNETLEYDDTLRQSEAQRAQYGAAMRIMNGDDPFQALYDVRHYEDASHNRTKQARPLMTPDEILAMPEDRQIVFVSGKSLKPIYAERHAYFSRTDLIGRFLPNPYHPPADRIAIPSRRGTVTLRVVREPVPSAFAHLPQYQDRTWSHIEGYRP